MHNPKKVLLSIRRRLRRSGKRERCKMLLKVFQHQVPRNMMSPILEW